MENLSCIQRILREATDIVCPSLRPTKVLRRLKAKGELTSGDVESIESFTSVDRQVDKLLDTLCLKPESAYIAFMNALEVERPDLYWDVKEIEENNNYIPSRLKIS